MTVKNTDLPFSSKLLWGLGLISFALLGSQILLTRILSVVFGYHYVFLIISVVMFGMTAGSLIVYFDSKFFLPNLTNKHLGTFSLLSTLTVFLSFFAIFWLPGTLAIWKIPNLILPIIYTLLCLPYILLGICISLCLTRYPEHIGKLYSINLIGSALGCLGSVLILNNMNAPSAIIFFSIICLIGSNLFHSFSKRILLTKISCLILVISFIILIPTCNKVKPFYTRDYFEDPDTILYEKWNFFSNISVRKPKVKPFGWGFSPLIKDVDIKTEELMVLIDRGAGTVMTKFNNLSDIEYMKLDISSLAYNVRPNNDVFIIGAGGGRDLLTAVMFGANSVTAAEINEDIIYAVKNVFKDYSENLFKLPQIKIKHGDARSILNKSKEKYNIIQASLIDSWAASVGGAFALSENSLYTTEAWNLYLKHLKQEGMLTFSRYHTKTHPVQTYRLLTLAKNSLKNIGINNPRPHIILARVPIDEGRKFVVTILVSKRPFTQSELTRLKNICDKNIFELVLTPSLSLDTNYEKILTHPNKTNYKLIDSNFNIDAPTDNKPFYFYYTKPLDFFKSSQYSLGVTSFKQVIAIILAFGTFFILIPLKIAARSNTNTKFSKPMLLYFSSIGLSFMFIEMAVVQRLGLYFQHPVYGLTVVLFSLLLACGIGSYFSKHIKASRDIKKIFAALIVFALLIQFLLPIVIQSSSSFSTPLKIIISILFLFPIGFCMGMPFPIGVSALAKKNDSPIIFYWGINGFFSMLGSVLATFILLSFGFQAAVFAGILIYLVALTARLNITD